VKSRDRNLSVVLLSQGVSAAALQLLDRSRLHDARSQMLGGLVGSTQQAARGRLVIWAKGWCASS